MKKLTTPLIAALWLAIILPACKKDTQQVSKNGVSEAALAQIQALGFSTQGVQKLQAGYLVEGDIFLTDAQLNSHPSSVNMIIAQEEQYHTFNMVDPSSHKTITVALDNSSPQHDAAFNNALDEAIRRYNAENLSISFSKVSKGVSHDITVVAFYEQSNVLGSSGFPSNGNPYYQVRMNTYWYSTETSSTNTNYIGTIMAHELGHCIGFRHTDYMRRSYSCGYGGNEGQAKNGIGAVWIPGTPTGPDAASWMLACIGNNVNRPFNANDKTALGYVY